MKRGSSDSKSVRRKRPRPENGSTYPSVDHLAREIGVSRHACYQAIQKGIIPHIRIGRRIILPKAAIGEWLKNAGSPNTISTLPSRM